MLRQILIFGFLTLLFALTTARTLIAFQINPLLYVTPEQMSQQGPLTQADIDLFVNFLSVLNEQSADKPDFDEGAVINYFLVTYQVDSVRLQTVVEKIPFVLYLLTPKPQNPTITTPDYFKISNEEIELVKSNKDKLLQAFFAFKK
ncbi:MAG: hypothetical protein LBI10_00385 [Deltaproteobacteria bacterium]|jgi:hypothetical protein|nr:hypothetical protein [Deltaproteobacteria bacterium]